MFKFLRTLQTPLLFSFRGEEFCVRNSFIEASPCSETPRHFEFISYDLYVVMPNPTYVQYIRIYFTFKYTKDQEVWSILSRHRYIRSESLDHKQAKQDPSTLQWHKEQLIQPEASKTCISASSLPFSTTRPSLCSAVLKSCMVPISCSLSGPLPQIQRLFRSSIQHPYSLRAVYQESIRMIVT